MPACVTWVSRTNDIKHIKEVRSPEDSLGGYKAEIAQPGWSVWKRRLLLTGFLPSNLPLSTKQPEILLAPPLKIIHWLPIALRAEVLAMGYTPKCISSLWLVHPTAATLASLLFLKPAKYHLLKLLPRGFPDSHTADSFFRFLLKCHLTCEGFSNHTTIKNSSPTTWQRSLSPNRT